MIHLKKFAIRDDWTPIKLDVSVEMPEELDISHLRGNGPQNDEKLMPETSSIIYISFYKPCIFVYIS